MKIVKILLVVMLLMSIQHSLALDYPKPVGYVNDYAGILTLGDVQKLETELKDFDNKTTIEIAVVTVKSLDGLPIESYTMNLMNNWGVGKKGKDNGVMLLVAPNERKVRIGTGSGMGQLLSDENAANIIQDDILPYFKKGDMRGGIIKGTESIMSHLSANPGQPVQTESSQSQAQNNNINDEDIKTFSYTFLYILFGLFFSIGFIVGAMRLRNLYDVKNKNLFQIGQCKEKLYGLVDYYKKSSMILNSSEESPIIWSDLKKDFNDISFENLDRELAIIENKCNGKVFEAEETQTLIEEFDKKLSNCIQICGKIEKRSKDIEKAKSDSLQLITTIPQKITKIREIVNQPDVFPKTKRLFESSNEEFLEVNKIMNGNNIKDINWLEISSKLYVISKNLDDAQKSAENDIDKVAEARIKGPEMLEKLPGLIEKLEKKLANSESVKARNLFNDAKGKYEEARSLSNKDSSDLLETYFMAIMANDLLNEAESNHTSYHKTHYSSNSEDSHKSKSDESWSSSGFSGFGGGGSSGGGSTGGW